MLSNADRAMMKAALLAIRDDRPVTITIRRAKTTLAAQVVRIARAANIPGGADSEGLQAATAAVTVLGDVALDIRPADRFTVNGALYEVLNVHPNKDAGTMAEARIVQ